MKIEAKNLKIGDRYKADSSIQEVIAIETISDKAITYRTNRISPDPYNGGFFNRKRLTTKVEIVKPTKQERLDALQEALKAKTVTVNEYCSMYHAISKGN